jgi:hypothetical protein
LASGEKKMQTIGIANAKYLEDVERLQKVLRTSLGATPQQVELQALAGPNDIIQWIADLETWQNIGLIALGWLGSKIPDEVWELLKQRLIERITEKKDASSPPPSEDAGLIAGLTEAIRAAQANGLDFELRISNNPSETEPFKGATLPGRGTYVSVPSLPEEYAETEVAKILVLVATEGARIEVGDDATLVDETSDPGGLILRHLKVPCT